MTKGIRVNKYIVSALAALAIAPAAAQAHDATVTCNRDTGSFIVVADFQHRSPTWTFTATTVIIRWTDGYVLTKPLPLPCELRPAPPPVIPPPPVVPPVTPPPAVTPPPSVVEPLPPVVTPPPAVTPPVKAKPKWTCKKLRAIKAHRSWYKRLRINYWVCHVPKQKPGVVIIPPVAG
jgi:hypothetical protein